MKLLVLSDSHGDEQRVHDIIHRHQDAAAVFHLGDGLREAENVKDAMPRLRLYTVRGNCDMMSFTPAEGLAPFGGVLVFYTHGHLYGVKQGLYELAEAAQRKGAQVALFGHTHAPELQQLGGVWLFNPGALAYDRSGEGSSYGLITIENGAASFEHLRL